MRKILVSTLAILLGVAWTVAPAVAGNTAEKVEQKAEKAESKTESTTEKIKDKAKSATEKVKEKTESAMDKVKAKTREVKEKVTGKAKNGDVRAAQDKLKLEGYDPGPIDGRMGPRTASAVRAYQKAEGLQQSGQLDQATMDKLGIQGGSAMPSMPAEATRQPQSP